MTREYKAIKNYIHNEMGITKSDFQELVKEAIKEEAKSFVKRIFQQQEGKLTDFAKDRIKDEVIKTISGSSWNSERNKFFEGLGKEIAKNLKVV